MCVVRGRAVTVHVLLVAWGGGDKSLIIKVQKSEVVCFNGQGTLPVFKLNGEELANKDTFKYLGMHFTNS